MTYSEARAELTDLFIGIYRTMEEEGESQWLRSIEGIIARLQEEESNEEAVLSVYQTYSFITSGAGSFSEYYLHRDDPYTMRAVNLPFDAKRTRAARILFAAKLRELDKLEPADEHPPAEL